MKALTMGMTALLATSMSIAAGLSKTRIPANVQKVTLDCDTPKGFSGLSAQVKGEVELTPLPQGSAKAQGSLQIRLLNPRDGWSGTKLVMGQYDDLTTVGSDRYFFGGATMKDENDILSVFANFSNPKLSYVEYKGENYKMTCK